jgi:hypothetical protein
MDPYAIGKVMGVDYRFWNVFHSNFYATTILTARKGKFARCNILTLMTCKRKKSLNSTLLSGSMTDLSLQPSCPSSVIRTWRS